MTRAVVFAGMAAIYGCAWAHPLPKAIWIDASAALAVAALMGSAIAVAIGHTRAPRHER